LYSITGRSASPDEEEIMKMIARITAVIFIILGLLIILTGAALAIHGYLTPAPQASSIPGQLPDLTGWVVVAEMIAGGVVALQGLFLAAIGEGLWLLASISNQSEKNGQHLYAMMRRGNQP
jgi:hypothetical protein